jgi:hypothetical protein
MVFTGFADRMDDLMHAEGCRGGHTVKNSATDRYYRSSPGQRNNNRLQQGHFTWSQLAGRPLYGRLIIRGVGVGSWRRGNYLRLVGEVKRWGFDRTQEI